MFLTCKPPKIYLLRNIYIYVFMYYIEGHLCNLEENLDFCSYFHITS